MIDGALLIKFLVAFVIASLYIQHRLVTKKVDDRNFIARWPSLTNKK